MYRWSDCYDELPVELQNALGADDISHHPNDIHDFTLCLSDHNGKEWCTAAMDSLPRGQSLSLTTYMKHIQQLSHAATYTKKARLEVRHPSMMHALDKSFEQQTTKQTDITDDTNAAMKRWRHWKPHHTQHLPPTTTTNRTKHACKMDKTTTFTPVTTMESFPTHVQLRRTHTNHTLVTTFRCITIWNDQTTHAYLRKDHTHRTRDPTFQPHQLQQLPDHPG